MGVLEVTGRARDWNVPPISRGIASKFTCVCLGDLNTAGCVLTAICADCHTILKTTIFSMKRAVEVARIHEQCTKIKDSRSATIGRRTVTRTTTFLIKIGLLLLDNSGLSGKSGSSARWESSDKEAGHVIQQILKKIHRGCDN